MANKIKLTNGKYVLVDSDNFEYLNKWKWRESNKGYACRNIRKGKRQGILYMHRLVTKADDCIIDHMNRNKLDNRICNLQKTDLTGNNINSKIRIDNVSGFKGISWHKEGKKYGVEIRKYNKRYWIGLFSTIEEAIGARFTAELEYYGDIKQ